MGCEILGRSLSDEAYAQSEQHACEGHLARRGYAAQDVGGRLFAQARQCGQTLGVQRVYVGYVVQHVVLPQQLDRLVAQALDVHRLARDEVLYASEYLGTAAALVGAVVFGLALESDQRRTAFGASVYILERPAVGGTLRKVDLRDLGYYLAALLYINRVAYADVQLRYLLGVVERGTLDGRAGQQHWRKVGYGGHGTRAADLKVDAEQPGGGTLGLELIGYRPARGFGCRAQLAAVVVSVDLDHHAVGGERQPLALGIPMGYVLVDLGYVAADAHIVRYLESPLASLCHVAPVRGRGQCVARELVERAVEPASCDHLRR